MADDKSIRPGSLVSRQTDLTQSLILDAAVELLQAASVMELSIRAVAKRANISERTVFRHFPSRDDLLDAVADEVSRRLDTPPDPTTVHELIAYPEAVFARFETNGALTRAVLHSELYQRVRRRDAGARGAAIGALVDRLAADRGEDERRLAAANILYHVIASTWRYYRDYFGFTVEETAAASRMAIVEALRGLGVATEP